jgi:lia operon protein LiaG
MRRNIVQSRNLAGTMALAFCLAAGLWARPAAAVPERHTIPGNEVVIYNLVGSLEIVPGTGSSVVAEVTLQGPDGSRLRIAKGTIRGKETLRVIYPGDRIRVPEFEHRTTTTIRVREDGTFSDENSGRGSGGRKVVLSGKEGIEASADIRILVPKGKKLEVKWGHGEGTVSRVDASVGIDAASMPVTVTDVKGPLGVDIGSGRVTVNGASGSIAIDTGSGEVDLRDVHGGRIDVDTGSGEVTGQGLDSDPVSISTGSGEIRLVEVRSDQVNLDSGSGEISVELNGSMKELVVDTGSGDVSVLIPRGTGADLSVETGSGDIETNLVVETRYRKRNELVGRIGTGGGSIRIETGSGNITLTEEKKK